MSEREVLINKGKVLVFGVLSKSGMLRIGKSTYFPEDDRNLVQSIPTGQGKEVDIDILAKYFPQTDLEIQVIAADTPSGFLDEEIMI